MEIKGKFFMGSDGDHSGYVWLIGKCNKKERNQISES